MLVPAATGKLVGKFKGAKAGAAAAGIAALLPIGETALATDHFVRSKEGKTALKAGSQVISGTIKDIKNKLKKDDSTKK